MKDYIRNIGMLLFFCLSLAFPIKEYDCFTDYDRLKVKYVRMKPSTFALIHLYSSKYKNLTDDKVCAVITYESNWNSKAISRSGARGLMQIMPFHYKGNSNDLYDEELNIAIGCQYLSWCIDHAHGNFALAMQYYNAGPIHPEKADMPYVRAIIASNRYTTKLVSKYDMEIE